MCIRDREYTTPTDAEAGAALLVGVRGTAFSKRYCQDVRYVIVTAAAAAAAAAPADRHILPPRAWVTQVVRILITGEDAAPIATQLPPPRKRWSGPRLLACSEYPRSTCGLLRGSVLAISVAAVPWSSSGGVVILVVHIIVGAVVIRIQRLEDGNLWPAVWDAYVTGRIFRCILVFMPKR